jgi:predicted O-linked N-acetylglucosamine transferase (SPINDLY family)
LTITQSNQESPEQSQLIFQNGLELLRQGKLDEADKCFFDAHRLNSKNVDALNLLGIRSYQKQEHKSALDFLNQANQIAPNSAQTLSNLGLVHNALCEFSEALHFFDLAIQCDPSIPETHNNRGNALKSLENNVEANKAYERAISLRPNYAEALSNQGVLLLESGNPEKAIALFEKAIAANPHFAVAFNNLGNAFTQIEHYNDAFECFERALQINPAYLDACLNFGNSLKKCKQYEAAIDCYQQALKIDPNSAKAFYLLGEVYYDLGDCALAKIYYAKSLESYPGDLETQIALAIAQIPKVAKNVEELSASRNAFSGQLEFLQANLQQKISPALSAKLITRHPFYLAYQDENNEALLSQFGEVCTGLAKTIQVSLDAKKRSAPAGSKIRVGIISSFICNHPVWYAITKGWVNHLNPDQFELHLFNTKGIEDEETKLAKSKVATYTNCGIDISDAAQIVADKNLDVILYPEIGMDTVSKALACLRLAPIQAVSWGHPETSGLVTIDFYLSAQLMEPADSHRFYSEKLVSLPNLGTYFEQDPIQAANLDLEKLGIDSHSPILLCAGSPAKYSPSDDQVLVDIAKRLGKCQFIFFNFNENLTAILKERLHEAFKLAKLNADEFIYFIPFLKKEEFHGLMQIADLYLDTIGFSGFNTAMQALSCDLPIITIEGSKMRGRLASAILYRMKLEELVCQSDLAYVDLVDKLMMDRSLLSAFKAKIAQSKAILFNDLEPIRALANFLIQQTRK